MTAMTSDGVLEYEATTGSGSVNSDKFMNFIRGHGTFSWQAFNSHS